MKSFAMKDISKNLKKIVDTVSKKKETIQITRNRVPVAVFGPLDEADIQEEVEAKARETIREIQIDTFTKKNADKLERTYGMCSRCGTQGEVVRKSYLNQYGTAEGKWLCLAKCFQGWKKPPMELTRSRSKETTFNSGHNDFGGSSEKNTF